MSELPPVPGPNLAIWAQRLVDYLRREQDRVDYHAVPVKLAHRVGDEKATENGIIMYDPSLEAVVVSINGQWVELSKVP